jgi:von Willebrand factor type D domain
MRYTIAYTREFHCHDLRIREPLHSSLRIIPVEFIQPCLQVLSMINASTYCAALFSLQVNGSSISVSLPYAGPGYIVSAYGRALRYEAASIGLVVTVNLWSVTVNINNTFATLLNGLCGNFDGNKTNDLMTENGTDVSGQPRGQGPKMIGDSYVVEDPEQLNGTAYVGLRFFVMAVMCIIVYVLGFR